MEIVIGDVAGAVLAFATIALLRHRSRLAIPLAWLLVAETAYDTSPTSAAASARI